MTKAGNNWDIALDDMLSGKAGKEEYGEELFDLYTDFIHSAAELQLSGQGGLLREINKVLGQNILILRLQDCIACELARYYALKPLFSLEERSYETAILFIDYIFSRRIANSVYDIPELPASFESDVRLPYEEYNKIADQFEIMLSETSACQGNKVKVMELWKEKYYTTNHILYYIAEKCCLICKMKSNRFL